MRSLAVISAAVALGVAPGLCYLGTTMVAVQTANGPVMMPSISNIKPIQQIQAQYAVALNAMNACKWTFYDSQAYPAAGIANLQFFANPTGQPGGFGGAGKTTSDTNVTNAGMLPSNQKFLIEALSLEFQPSTPSGAGIQDPAFYGAGTKANAGVPPVNDAWYVLRSGTFTLSIGGVTYTQEAPLYKLPPLSFPRIDAALSDTSTAGTDQETQIALLASYGSPYVLDPYNLLLEAGMNYSVSLSWPEGNQAITKPGRFFVNLHGTLYRNVQ